MRTFLHQGDTIDVLATGPVVSGSFQIVGKIFGFAESDAVSGQTYALKVKGVFEAAKAAGAITAGQALYWDAAASNFTTTATSNTFVGVAAAAAATGDTTVKLRLSGHFAA
ncbi:DUF2190 family protein [Roseomonas chloroacetimidivorans]|uniref:DUF2190 family protein n=1 Tax=Roseomonas chloroacetimidivorans TaxID=1766656 RepID=UPI003C77590B